MYPTFLPSSEIIVAASRIDERIPADYDHHSTQIHLARGLKWLSNTTSCRANGQHFTHLSRTTVTLNMTSFVGWKVQCKSPIHYWQTSQGGNFERSLHHQTFFSGAFHLSSQFTSPCSSQQHHFLSNIAYQVSYVYRDWKNSHTSTCPLLWCVETSAYNIKWRQRMRSLNP